MALTRRAFMQNSAVLAAGAAAGSAGLMGIREHGPVMLWTYFFSEKPISFKGEVFSDERRDVFGIRILNDDGRKHLVAEMPLVDMRKVLESGRQKTICLCIAEEHTPCRMPLAVVAEDGKITFLVDEPGSEPTPLWLSRGDVLRVL